MKTLCFFFVFFASVQLYAQKEGTMDISGTTWFKTLKGVEDLDNQHMTFLPNGRIYEELDENSPNLDHFWTQEGKKVTFSYNSSYATYTGKIKGNTIVGKAKNITGKTWSFKLILVEQPPQPQEEI